MTAQQNIEAASSSPGQPADASRVTSFEEVYEAYFDFAWTNLRRMGVRAALLDDAVQDLFMVVHRRLREFAGRSSIKTWLAAIAWRVASDYRRHETRKGGTEPLPDTLAANVPDPHGAAVHAEALRRLDALLRHLDDEKRAVFVLAELEQMSVPEIAEALGINLNTVYSRLRAARRAFDEALQIQKRSDR